ncbi:Acetyltransferase (GNAT) family protein [Actinopolyspora xinjiangensis]|uniref:Acetyltransferase (GNAT) family protein n=1 Tax=Actinopolyspora xinjiangensis TaxID=405564 RepID=A0A1H0W2C1_9ACTN|nr:GNAT family N-acetyltransferase [Actinopolyspora xinjiangensis]SDP84675.1 Acetyltransferase (GNAT) family protein [Actinopolyspora xinjiangensis]
MIERDSGETDHGRALRRVASGRSSSWWGLAVVVLGTAQLALSQLDAARGAAWSLTVGGLVWLLVSVTRETMSRIAGRPCGTSGRRRIAGEPTTVELAGSGDRALWRVRASVSDEPGGLASLADRLARLGGDIRTMQVHPVTDAAVDEFLLHLPAEVGHTELVGAVAEAGGREVIAERTGPRELDDVPTRALRLATGLMDGTDDLRSALRPLLGDVEVRWLGSAEEAGTGIGELAGHSICLEHPDGGVLLLRRGVGEFTPAEFARARAMTELAAIRTARASRTVEHRTARDGSEFAVRGADRSDLAGVRRLHENCSSASRHRRYFVGGTPTRRQLEVLLTPALGSTTLATSPDGEVVAMGGLDHDGTTGELALLVRDDWQGLGVGSALRDALLARARELGLGTVRALTQLDNTAMARTLRSAGFKHVGADEPGEWSWALELRENFRHGGTAPEADRPVRRTLAETSPC